MPANAINFPTFNTVATPSQINDWDQYNVRIDHQVSSRDMIFGSFSYSNEDRDLKALRPLGGEGFPLQEPAGYDDLEPHLQPDHSQ